MHFKCLTSYGDVCLFKANGVLQTPSYTEHFFLCCLMIVSLTVLIFLPPPKQFVPSFMMQMFIDCFQIPGTTGSAWTMGSLEKLGTKLDMWFYIYQFSSVQSLSCVQLFVIPWTAARLASLSITNSQSLIKLMSIESVMPSNDLILCHPLLLPPSIFPSIGLFLNESVLCIRWQNYLSFSFNISPSNEHSTDLR